MTSCENILWCKKYVSKNLITTDKEDLPESNTSIKLSNCFSHSSSNLEKYTTIRDVEINLNEKYKNDILYWLLN